MSLPSDEPTLYRALLRRDAAYDGLWFVGVRTTGIYCRLTCPARKPKRENVEFFPTPEAARDAGFRACRRCRPEAGASPPSPVVARLVALLRADPARRWQTADLRAHGIDPSTARRAFRRAYGTTFAQYARVLRLGAGVAALKGGQRVVDAQHEAGYASSSGFREAIAALVGESPRDVPALDPLTACWLDTPIGAMLAVADSRGVHLLEFVERRALPTELARLQRRRGPACFGSNAVLEALTAEIAEYFAGRRTRFDVPVVQHGTAFEQRLWTALSGIPLGTTRTYGELAAALGCASAPRAIGRANGANAVAIVVPCHRVLGADGSPTGYGGGIWRKQWLLEHESRVARERRSAA
jgi:AraC family transcriptional regulator of adaptative response/methylated-DNA-[protein]-cysteine methyltransferase